MIQLTLLHPTKSTPIQHWRFLTESVIRIGRSSNNHVVLYSAVVSRHHIELRKIADRWELINLGMNGTYINGTKVTKIPLVNESIIRVARSGPRMKIYLHSYVPPTDSTYTHWDPLMNSDYPESETAPEELTQSVFTGQE